MTGRIANILIPRATRDGFAHDSLSEPMVKQALLAKDTLNQREFEWNVLISKIHKNNKVYSIFAQLISKYSYWQFPL